MSGGTVIARATGAAALAVTLAAQAPNATVEIISPPPDIVIAGMTRFEAVVPSSLSVLRVSITVDGQVICTPAKPPYGCQWDAGTTGSSRHIRVVAYLADGRSLVANLHTKDLGYSERVDVDAVQVPAVVTHNGKFVPGLTKADFAVAEDDTPQKISTLISEDVPLDLVLAIDISGSMTDAIGDVKRAVKQLLGKLRPGDAATLVGFNETPFILAERETDQQAREAAVDLLAPWGGTALYDATLRALDLLAPQHGRKGVVIFSDGDDRDSLTRAETAMTRVQASDAMLFTVAFGRGAQGGELQRSLESFARDSGGRAFVAHSAAELDHVFGEIVEDLANQYVLSYSPSKTSRAGEWHRLKVTMTNGKYNVRARQGYRTKGALRSGGGL
jgi:Ca-activated chloride channel homolog